MHGQTHTWARSRSALKSQSASIFFKSGEQELAQNEATRDESCKNADANLLRCSSSQPADCNGFGNSEKQHAGTQQRHSACGPCHERRYAAQTSVLLLSGVAAHGLKKRHVFVLLVVLSVLFLAVFWYQLGLHTRLWEWLFARSPVSPILETMLEADNAMIPFQCLRRPPLVHP